MPKVPDGQMASAPQSLWDHIDATRAAYKLTLGDDQPRKRLNAWREMMRDRKLEVAAGIDEETIEGAITGQVFSGGALANWTLSRQKVVRTPRIASGLDNEYVFVSIIQEGDGGIEQDGNEVNLKPGDLAITDGTRPFSAFASSTVAKRGYFHLPKSALRQRLGRHEELVYGVYRASQHPLQRLASSFLGNLTGLVGSVDLSTLETLAEQSLDIIALLANERQPGAIEPSTHQSAMLLRAKAHMKANLKNPTYSLEQAAAALNVSPRYLNVLFSREQTSFGRRLLGARLEAARRDITNPRFVHRQVTEIAFDWGFNNASHFGKVFRDRFGMTPREAKAQGMYASIGAAA